MHSSGFRFSRQEEKVLALSMSGLSDKEIATRMEIGLGTVRTFWKRIRSKAGGSTRTEVIMAMSRGAADQVLEEDREQNIQLIAEITRRQAAEEGARQKERDFTLLAEAIPAGVFTLSGGRLDFVNDHWIEWSGIPRELIHNNQWGSLHPDDVPRAQEAWQESAAARRLFELECRLCYRDGSYRWNLVRAVPAPAIDGVTKRWIGSITDIQGLKDAEVQYRNLFECSLDPVFLTDLNGRFVDVNQAATDVLGYTKREFLTKTMKEMIPAGSEENHQKASAELKASGIWKGVLPLVAKNGLPVLLQWSTTRLAFPDATLVVVRPILEPRPVMEDEVYTQAFERARVGIGVIDGDGQLELLNDRFAELLGHQPQSIQGLRLPSLITFSDRKRLEAAITRADAEGDAQAGLSMLHANGGLISVLIDVSSIVKDGRVLRRIVTLRRTADSSRRF